MSKPTRPPTTLASNPDERVVLPSVSELARLRLKSKSDSDLASGFRAAALCRTKTGWAVAVLEVDASGMLAVIDIGPSQSFPDHVASKLKKVQMGINQETLTRSPWRPGA